MVTAAPSMMYHEAGFLSRRKRAPGAFLQRSVPCDPRATGTTSTDLDQISRSNNVTVKISTLTQALTWKKATFNRPRLAGETSECS